MSVQSEIDRIITAVGNAYSKVSEKGGTVPASQTVANLATAIDSIPAGGGAPSLQSKSVTYTSNGTATITPDEGYDGLSSVDVTVNVSGGYNLKKVTYKASANKLLTDITITHNCGSIPKFVIVTSNDSSVTTYYLTSGSGANESQTSSFLMVINNVRAQASVTSTTFNYNNDASIRYYHGTIYTYYFFY